MAIFMTKILVGVLLTMFNLALNVNGHVLRMPPAFLGYIVIFFGIREVCEKHEFDNAAIMCKAATAWFALSFVLELFAINLDGIFGFIMALVSTFLSLAVLYQLIEGIRGLEEEYETKLNAENLKAVFQLYALLQIVIIVLGIIATFVNNFIFSFIGGILILASLVIAIAFLLSLNKSRTIYNSLEFVEEDEEENV